MSVTGQLRYAPLMYPELQIPSVCYDALSKWPNAEFSANLFASVSWDLKALYKSVIIIIIITPPGRPRTWLCWE